MLHKGENKMLAYKWTDLNVKKFYLPLEYLGG